MSDDRTEYTLTIKGETMVAERIDERIRVLLDDHERRRGWRGKR